VVLNFLSNGDIFVGSYKFGKSDSEGQYTWKNGSVYKGQFVNGMKHGKGKWMKSRDVNSNVYEGDYYMDTKQGYGEFKWDSGNLYKGNYKNDLRNGYGEMYWTDGSIYKGNWINGIQHGYGKMIFLDGTINEGIFDHNVYQGPVGGHNSDITEENSNDENDFSSPKNEIEYESDEFENNATTPQYEEKQLTHRKNKKLKKKITIRNKSKTKIPNLITEDEEIQHIIKTVKSQKKFEEEMAQKKLKKSLKRKSKSKKRLTPKKRKNTSLSSTHDARQEQPHKIRRVKQKKISIDDSLDMYSQENISQRSKESDFPRLPPQASDFSSNRAKVLVNVTLPARSIKQKKNKKGIATDVKKHLNDSSMFRYDQVCYDRDNSVPASYKEDRMFNRRLFGDREKTIIGTNSLANHGIQNRRSRAGKHSKVALRLQDISQDNDDNGNKTTTIFPTIDNHTSKNNYSTCLSSLYRLSRWAFKHQEQPEEKEEEVSSQHKPRTKKSSS